MKYRFDVFNVTNTTSFDIPLDNISQNAGFNSFPTVGQQLYTPASQLGLGVTNKTIGSPRQVQMSLAFSF